MDNIGINIKICLEKIRNLESTLKNKFEIIEK